MIRPAPSAAATAVSAGLASGGWSLLASMSSPMSFPLSSTMSQRGTPRPRATSARGRRARSGSTRTSSNPSRRASATAAPAWWGASSTTTVPGRAEPLTGLHEHGLHVRQAGRAVAAGPGDQRPPRLGADLGGQLGPFALGDVGRVGDDQVDRAAQRRRERLEPAPRHELDAAAGRPRRVCARGAGSPPRRPGRRRWCRWPTPRAARGGPARPPAPARWRRCRCRRRPRRVPRRGPAGSRPDGAPRPGRPRRPARSPAAGSARAGPPGGRGTGRASARRRTAAAPPPPGVPPWPAPPRPRRRRAGRSAGRGARGPGPGRAPRRR